MKLISWNVQWFCGLDGTVDIDRVLRRARDLADFDVLCLQEVADNYPRLQGGASHDQPALLRERLPGFEVCFGAAVDELADDGSGRRRRFGNVIATRLPLLQLKLHALPYPAEAGVPSMPRIALAATVRAPWGPLRVMTTHLEYYSAAMRLAQARALAQIHAEAVALTRCPPLADDGAGPFGAKPQTEDGVLTGDFNCEPGSDAYRAVTADDGTTPRFVDCWQRAHAGAPHAPTFRLHDRSYGPNPIACDFVFATPAIAARVRRAEVDGATRVSDHQPVLVEFAD